MTIGLWILTIYMIAMLAVAYYASKRDQKTIKDFAVGSGFGIFILTLTFSTTYHSAFAFMGAAGFAHTHGIGWWANGLWTVLPGILFWVLGRRFWFMGKKYGYISTAEYISDVYQSKLVGLIVGVTCIVFTVPFVAMQAIGSGYIFNIISEGRLTFATGIVIFFVVLIILVYMGGMRGIALTDAGQGTFMWLGMLIGSFVILHTNFGSVGAAYESAQQHMPELFSLPGPRGVVTPGDWFSRWTVITLGMMMFPHISLRFFAGKSLRVLKWSAVFSSIYLTSIYVFTPAIGFVGHLLIPDLAAADRVFPEMLLAFTPLLFASLVIAGAYVAAQSTADSQLHASSSMIGTDIYRAHINKKATDRQVYRVARISVIVLGIFSIAIALINPGLLGDILLVANAGVAVLAPTVIGGAFWKKATKQGALVSIICGQAVNLFLTFVVGGPIFTLAPGFCGLIVAFVLYVVVCNVTASRVEKRTIQVIDSINEYFAPPAENVLDQKEPTPETEA